MDIRVAEAEHPRHDVPARLLSPEASMPKSAALLRENVRQIPKHVEGHAHETVFDRMALRGL